jgi:hypothetical protein
MMGILLFGGVFRSLQFTSINTIAYAEIGAAQMSRATAMAAVGQQLALSCGVAVGALVVESTLRWTGGTEITAEDFAPAFIVVGLISASSALIFARGPRDAGAEMSGHVAVKAAEPIAAAEKADRRLG